MTHIMQDIQDLRKFCFGDSDPKITALHELEKTNRSANIHFYMPGNTAFLKEIADHRYQTIFSRVNPLAGFSNEIHKLEKAKNKLQRLIEVFPSSNTRLIQKKLRELPEQFKHWLYWSLWMRDWLKNGDGFEKPIYGQKKIEDNVLLIRDTQDQIICLRGSSLAEQLLCHIEEQISLKRQQEIYSILQNLTEMMEYEIINPEFFLAEFSRLPTDLQWQIYDELYEASKKNPDFKGESGQSLLENDPHLIQLLHHCSSGQTILEHHLETQQVWMHACEQAALFGEFELASLLYPQMSSLEQKNEFLKWMAPQVRKWIYSLVKLSNESVIPFLTTEKRLEAQPLYQYRGAHPDREETTFRIYAPKAQSVSVLLTIEENVNQNLPMTKSSDGIWETSTPLAKTGNTYVYEIIDCKGKKMTRVDPFSFSTVHQKQNDHIHSVVVDQNAYVWQDKDWMINRELNDPLQKPLSIYEIQIKSWKMKDGKPLNYRQLAPELIAYSKKMGFTHVELYGVMEHIWHISHGYQISNFFAPYHELGCCEDLKSFINALHQNGLGVILDWVPTHFQHYHDFENHSSSMHKLDGSNLYAAEKTSWGTRYLDFGKEETRRVLMASAFYWLKEMHIDGFRVDAVSQLVRRNGSYIDSGISFLKELNQMIASNFPGVLKIAEDTEGFPNVTKPLDQDGLGFDLEWAITWNYESRDYLRTPYHERAREEHHEGKMLNYLRYSQFAEKYILSQSHDDCDCKESKKNLYHFASHAPNDHSRFADLRNFHCWKTLAPSHGHLTHMGEEWAQPESWYPRIEKNLTGIQWESVKDRSESNFHYQLQMCVKDLNFLYQNHPAFWEKGIYGFQMISECKSNSIIAYYRTNQKNDHVAVIHNFSDKGHLVYDLPLSKENEYLISRDVLKISEIFNSDAPKYGGSGKYMNKTIEILRDLETGAALYFRMSIPPLSTVVLKPMIVT